MTPIHFDPDALFNLLGDDKPTIVKMLENIVIGASKKFDALHTDLAAQNWDLVKGDAHFLKSNFRYLGATDMAALLKEIEISAIEPEKRASIPAMVTKFSSVFPSVMQEVTEYVNYLKS